MALWRVLDLNERAASRRGQAPAIAKKQNEKNRAGRNETPRGKRASPLNRLAIALFLFRLVRVRFIAQSRPVARLFSSYFVLPCIVRSAANSAHNADFYESSVIFSLNPLTFALSIGL